MRTIIIVEATSTGANYVADIMKRGYQPVVLELQYGDSPEMLESIRAHRAEARKKYPCDPVTIQASEDYQETLEKVAAFDPVLVIAGSELGSEMAIRLSADLNLPGNPVENIDRYLKKSAMHAALIKAGVRGIRGRIVKTYEEAAAFMKEIGTENIVVKPVHSAASQGVKLCRSAEEVKEGMDNVIGKHNYYGVLLDEVLLQERIFGTEYIVNTLSRGGKHKMVSMWRYDKVKTDEGGNPYNFGESLTEPEIGHSELVEYAFSVLDAIGITDGPIHGEYMIDKNGPILIEINCRVMGADLSAGFVDRIFGHHETDLVLDAFLNEDQFLKHLNDPYRPLRKGIIKSIITPKEVDVEASPIRVILDHMQSVYTYSLNESSGTFHLNKTEDLDSNSGMIYLVHDNPEVVRRECDLLHLLEEKYFRILFHGIGKKETPPDENALSVADAFRQAECRGASLIVSDLADLPEGVQNVMPDRLAEALGGYDQVFFALSAYGEGREVETTIRTIFDAMEKVKQGGRFIVPETFYQLIPYGRTLIEALLSIGGFRIEAPLYNTRRMVIGTRIR